MATPTKWTHTHTAVLRSTGRRVEVCYSPLDGTYLTRSEWRKVFAGGTPDLPADRYTRVSVVQTRGPRNVKRGGR